jgi:hypothetical protein
MDKMKIRNLLEKCWKEIEVYYKSNSISSERSLQAEIYSNLRKLVGKTCKVLVEPSIQKYIPDIVLVDSNQVICVVEIKFAPHWWISGSGLKGDINKLVLYSKLPDFEPVIFGPKRVFDANDKKWLGERTIFSFTDETVFCFAVITRNEAPSSNLAKLKKYSPEISSINNFCLLSGSITVYEEEGISSEEFTIESVF